MPFIEYNEDFECACVNIIASRAKVSNSIVRVSKTGWINFSWLGITSPFGNQIFQAGFLILAALSFGYCCWGKADACGGNGAEEEGTEGSRGGSVCLNEIIFNWGNVFV